MLKKATNFVSELMSFDINSEWEKRLKKKSEKMGKIPMFVKIKKKMFKHVSPKKTENVLNFAVAEVI